VALIIVGGISYLGYYFSTRKDNSREIYTDWRLSYNPKDKNPYGTFVLKTLLDSLELGTNFEELETQRRVQLDSNDIFLFVGPKMYLSNANRDSLIKHVSEGATALLILEELDDEFVNLLLYENIDVVHDDSIAQFSFSNDSLKGTTYDEWYMSEKEFDIYPWRYISEDNFYHKSAKVLGTGKKGSANFVRFKLGDGYVFLHTSPLAFTNLNMLRKDGFLYAEKVFSHLPPGTIQYHSYARNKSSNSDEDGGEGGGGEEPKRSPLEYVLSQPALKWAFFTLVAMLFLNLIFRSRRKRRPVKLVAKKTNTTVGHIDTVASIFMQQRQHQKLVAIKEKNFYKFVQNHYFLTVKAEGKTFDKRLSEKSGIDINRITDIRESLEQNKSRANQATLHEIHKRIDYFYKNSSVANKLGVDKKRFTRNYEIKTNLLTPLLSLGIGALLSIVGLLLLVMSFGMGILPIAFGVTGMIYGFLKLNKKVGSIKNDVFTVAGNPEVKINLKELKQIKIDGNQLYLEDFNGHVTLNLKSFPSKDRGFFEALANKYKTN
jgi:hypothetical protein